MNGYYFGYDSFFFHLLPLCVCVCVRASVGIKLVLVSFHICWSFHSIFAVFLCLFLFCCCGCFCYFCVYFGQMELLKVKGINGSLILLFFSFFIFEYNLWWSQKICELRFMQIEEKLPKTIQMWLAESLVVVAVVKVTKMRKRIFYLTCISNAIVHISNIEYPNFQWKQLKWINRSTMWNPCKLIGIYVYVMSTNNHINDLFKPHWSTFLHTLEMIALHFFLFFK